MRTGLQSASNSPLAWTLPRWALCADGLDQKLATLPIPLEGAGSVCSVRANEGLRRQRKHVLPPFRSVLFSALLQRSRSKQNPGQKVGSFLQTPPHLPRALSGLPALFLEVGCSIIQEEQESAYLRAYLMCQHTDCRLFHFN